MRVSFKTNLVVKENQEGEGIHHHHHVIVRCTEYTCRISDFDIHRYYPAGSGQFLVQAGLQPRTPIVPATICLLSTNSTVYFQCS